MGYYIPGPRVNKASYLKESYGAIGIDKPKAFSDVPVDKALIVVFWNKGFEAAAYCFSESEFVRFSASHMDQRLRQHLLMDLDVAQRVSGYNG
jgi:hypothetical protein